MRSWRSLLQLREMTMRIGARHGSRMCIIFTLTS